MVYDYDKQEWVDDAHACVKCGTVPSSRFTACSECAYITYGRPQHGAQLAAYQAYMRSNTIA